MTRNIFVLIIFTWAVADNYLAFCEVYKMSSLLLDPVTNDTTNKTLLQSQESSISPELGFMKNTRVLGMLKSYSLFVPRVYETGSSNLLLTTKTTTGHVERITLHVDDSFTGTTHVINLNLTDMHWQEGFFNLGEGKNNYPSYKEMKQSHCYYHGYTVGGDLAKFSTCYGLSGEVSLRGSGVIFIEPLYMVIMQDDSLRFHHLIYRKSDYKRFALHGGISGIERQSRHRHRFTFRNNGLADKNDLNKTNRNRRSFPHETPRWAEPYNVKPETTFIELYIIADRMNYLKNNKDYDGTLNRLKGLVNMANTIYQAVGIYVVMTGYEIWAKEDKVNVHDETNVRSYIKNLTDKFDVAIMLAGHGRVLDSYDKQFWTSKGGMCHKSESIAWFRDKRSITAGTNVVTHLIGRLFGLDVYRKEECHCGDTPCQMHEPNVDETILRPWSNCAVKYFKEMIMKKRFPCIHNEPIFKHVAESCGNGLKEKDEQCDCGQSLTCKSKCCKVTECKLHADAFCSNGLCCDLETCQYKKNGTVCRPSKSCCDLPEFCSGKSDHCPKDVFIENGFRCTALGENSLCYDGECRTYIGECQWLWGLSAKLADSECYKMDYKNQCQNQNHKNCDIRDLRCLTVLCASNFASYWIPDFVETYTTDPSCKVAIWDLMDRKRGMATDGFLCDTNSVCLSGRCVNITNGTFPKRCECKICDHLGKCFKGNELQLKPCQSGCKEERIYAVMLYLSLCTTNILLQVLNLES